MNQHKINEVMTQSCLSVIDLVAPGKTEEDYIVDEYTNTVYATFRQLTAMGIVSEFEEKDETKTVTVDVMSGSVSLEFPIVHGSCSVLPSFPNCVSAYFIAFSEICIDRRLRISLSLICTLDKDNTAVVKRFWIPIMDAELQASSLAEVARFACTGFVHTERSMAILRDWAHPPAPVEEETLWVPSDGESVIYIDGDDIMTACFCAAEPAHRELLAMGNCFSNTEDATRALERKKHSQEDGLK